MRTKEKFYENLNKKHVSLEKRQERFEFKDVSTLDTLVTEINSTAKLINESDKRVQKAKELYVEKEKQVEMANTLYDEEKRNLEAVRKENEKRMEDAHKDMKMRFDDLDDLTDKRDVAAKSFNEEANENSAHIGYGNQLVDEMENNINTFRNSAKALGIDVSSKVSKYENAVSKLKNLI